MNQKSQTGNPLPPLGVVVTPSAILIFAALKPLSVSTISLCLFFILIFPVSHLPFSSLKRGYCESQSCILEDITDLSHTNSVSSIKYLLTA